jgi:hypothetical protein
MSAVKRLIGNFTKEQRIIGALAVVLFVVAVVIAVTTLVSRIGKVAVVVKFAPFDTTVALNGTPVKNNATNYVLPGNYILTAEREHFEGRSENITIAEGDKYVFGKLMPSDEEGMRIATERQGEFLEIEGIMGGLADEEGAALKEKWPILKYLPVNNQFYSISYSYDAGEPVVRVRAVDEYMMEIAKQKMASWGVDIGNMRVEYEVGGL